MINENDEWMVEKVVAPLADGGHDCMEFSDVCRRPLEPGAEVLTKEGDRMETLREDRAHDRAGGVSFQVERNLKICWHQNRGGRHDVLQLIESLLCILGPMEIILADEGR